MYMLTSRWPGAMQKAVGAHLHVAFGQQTVCLTKWLAQPFDQFF